MLRNSFKNLSKTLNFSNKYLFSKENIYYNKFKLQKQSDNIAPYVIHLHEKSGIVVSIERLDQQEYLTIKKKQKIEPQEQEKQQDNNDQQQSNENTNINSNEQDRVYQQYSNEYYEKKYQDQQKEEEQRSKNQKSFFLPEEVLYGKFETWFLSQSLIACGSIGIYLLWKNAELSEGTELKDFLEKYFTQYNTPKLDHQGNEIPINHFPNAILSGFSHQSLPHLVCNMGILLVFARRIHEHLGVKKFWALYLGSIIGGYFINMINYKIQPNELQKDGMIRRLNIMRGQNLGFANNRSDGASDAIQALVAFTYCSLATKTFIFPQHMHLWALAILPTYFLEDLSNYFYPKKDTTDFHINKPHIGGFVYGFLFYILNEIQKKQFLQNLDRRKIYIMALSLSLYTIFYWYLNEQEYGGIRISQNRIGQRHELLVNYYHSEISQIKQNIETRYIPEFNLSKFMGILENINGRQIKEGDKPFMEIHEQIQKIKEKRDRDFVIRQLEKNYFIQHMPYKEARYQRKSNYYIMQNEQKE